MDYGYEDVEEGKDVREEGGVSTDVMDGIEWCRRGKVK